MSAILRYNLNEIFQTDSQEYEILYNSAKAVKVPGAVCEIGTRRGGSAAIIMQALHESDQANGRPFFCIDPYGNIELEITNINATIHYPGTWQLEDEYSKEKSFKTKFDYTNEMRNNTVPALYGYAFSLGFNFTFFCLEDTEFFKRYADGVPVYSEFKTVLNEYAFVFIDGPHTNEAVVEELDFFIPRVPVGGIIVGDDVWMYDHDKYFEARLLDAGFEILYDGKIKKSYIRKK